MTIFQVPPSKSKKQKGFTLVEILIGLALIGLIMGLGINQVGKMFSRNMKASARQLASTVRFLYNKSSTDGVTLRLVIDFDEQSYSVEKTSGDFTLAKEEEEKKEEEAPKEVFGAEGSKILKTTKLAKGVFFKDVYAEHQSGPKSEGKAYIYFFAQGYAENSVINLRDKDDKTNFSLVIHPISGKVSIQNKYQELEEKK